MIRVSTMLLVAVMLLTATASAQNYFPLDQGLAWTYVDDLGANLESTIAGTEVVGDVTAVIMHHEQSGAEAQTFRNYWTREESGDTWLHGAWNADGFSATYNPPILWIDAPLSAGQIWTTTFGWDGISVTVAFEVFEATETTVPLGTFFGYAIGPTDPGLLTTTDSHDILGRRLADSGTRDVNRWTVENLGDIRTYEFELEAFSGSVATAVVTWSNIKSLFRP